MTGDLLQSEVEAAVAAVQNVPQMTQVGVCWTSMIIR